MLIDSRWSRSTSCCWQRWSGQDRRATGEFGINVSTSYTRRGPTTGQTTQSAGLETLSAAGCSTPCRGFITARCQQVSALSVKGCRTWQCRRTFQGWNRDHRETDCWAKSWSPTGKPVSSRQSRQRCDCKTSTFGECTSDGWSSVVAAVTTFKGCWWQCRPRSE